MTSPAQTTQPLSPQLAEIVAQIEAASREARALVEGMAPGDVGRRPAHDRWSVAECIAHLTLTTKGYLPILEAAYEDARARGLAGSGKFKPDLMGRFLKWSIEPPPRFRVKTTAPFQPVEIEPVDRVLPDFLASQEELEAAVRRADGLALGKVKITSPFNASMKYNLIACFLILAAHERRHLWQAMRAKADLGR